MPEPGSSTQVPARARAGEVAVVNAGDYVNKQDGHRLERECRDQLARGCRALVISFRATELVNSIGISILLGVIDAAEQAGARVVFSSVSRHNLKLFDLLGLTRHVVLAESEEAAINTLQEFNHPPAPGH